MYPCRLLIIDDDIDDIEVLSDALHQLGCNCFQVVNSAEEAFRFLEECTSEATLPKLIVTDLYLPAITGVQFIKALQQDLRYSKINIVVFSTLKLELVLDFDKDIGTIDYIEKPCTYQDYLKVAAIFDQKSAA